ncbi:MAG: M15 family metallopeptidase [Bacteroidales bacterium]|nr:M15 family metallopeptidase [Bacteroidales bacterium]
MGRKVQLIQFIIFSLIISFVLHQCKSHTSENIVEEQPVSIDTVITPELQKSQVVIDCFFTLGEASSGIKIPDYIKNNLVLLNVSYFGFDSLVHNGQILVASEFAEEVENIFKELADIKFPIEKVIPVSAYNWSDSLSMIDNNTSCFNYRTVTGCRWLSHHALGRAIDVNPRLNPYYQKYTNIKHPYNATYDTSVSGTLIKGSQAVEAFKKRGWRWGGDWYYSKDYQHFYKPIPKE